MARSFGCDSLTADDIYPDLPKLHSTYYTLHTGSNYQVGDIIVFGQQSYRIEDLGYLNGHASYVAEIKVPNNIPDGTIVLGPNGVWRDDDPIGPGDDNNIIMHEVSSVDGDHSRFTLAQVKSNRLTYGNEYVKGFYRLKPEYKQYSVTFQNNFGSGQSEIYAGRFANGNFANRTSPFTLPYTSNSLIEAKVKPQQTIGSTTWQFNNDWRNNAFETIGSVDSISILVTGSNTYTSWFTSTTYAQMVRFQNHSDGTSIGSIIKVNGKEHLSPTPYYAIPATAEVYSSIYVDRVQYQFANWSTGSTNLTLSPSSAGTYTANYNYVSVSPPADIYPYANPVGDYIKITWTKHPSPYVTEYQVWRKVKNVHGPTVIATLPNTTTSFTDYECTLTPGYTHDLIDYGY